MLLKVIRLMVVITGRGTQCHLVSVIGPLNISRPPHEREKETGVDAHNMSVLPEVGGTSFGERYACLEWLEE
jgi:hypothetical protein